MSGARNTLALHDAGNDRDSSEYKSKRNTNALTDAEVQIAGHFRIAKDQLGPGYGTVEYVRR